VRLAVIPARGGSKRIPRKNIRPFAGKPMIAWSIEAALASGCFDRVVVSTDDDEIAAVAAARGAEVPFRRPQDLADDHAGTVAVVAHAIGELMPADGPADIVCCIYATAPFVSVDDLRRGEALLGTEACDYVLPVARYPYPIQRALRLAGDGRVSMFDPARYDTRSQDLEPAWHDAGQFYWGRAGAWRARRPVLGPGSVAIPLPAYRVQDIDTPEDWTRAEWMFRTLQATNAAATAPANPT